jgi:hypothetical protein
LHNSPLDLTAIRQRYQKALLSWLKAPDAGDGLRQMRAVLGAVALIHPPKLASFWRDAEAVMLALVEGRLQVDIGLRKLAGKLDVQLRQLATGETLPDRALWEELKQTLARLVALPPVADKEATDPMAAVLAQTASILPFVAQAKLPRFSENATEIWQGATDALLKGWGVRYQAGWSEFRSAVFGLCGAALTMGEPAFLRLSEALASASDRVDDDFEPPGHLVAAIAAVMECLGEKEFLEHKALYERLDVFATRLEKAADEEMRAVLVRHQSEPNKPKTKPEIAAEVRLPQNGVFAATASPIYDYLQGLKQEPTLGEEPLPEAVMDEVEWQSTPIADSEFPVEEISAPVPTFSVSALSADGQLLGRVARDLEALANSLNLSGLARQANRLATLVDHLAQDRLDEPEVRADLLSVIQYMQDQVGAVAMGLPPHANPKITDLMQKLEGHLPQDFEA